MHRNAKFSPCMKYRYSLTRVWGTELSTLAFIMLNPSTADGYTDDPTIRRCIGFARDNEYSGIHVVNLFAYIATKPKELMKLSQDERIGPENDRVWKTLHELGHHVVFAWGAIAGLGTGADLQIERALKMFPDAYCLGVTRKGSPRHPLMLSRTAQLVPYVRARKMARTTTTN